MFDDRDRPMMTEPRQRASAIAVRLYREYYRDGKALPVSASSHWRSLYEDFDVEIDETGTISRIVGSGFGGSEHLPGIHRIFANVFALAQRSTLRLAGLAGRVRAARQLTRSMGLAFTQDGFRQACTAAFLLDPRWAPYFEGGAPRTIMVIGDGPGILSGLLHQAFPHARIVLVDLGATLLFQTVHLEDAFPDAIHSLAGSGSWNFLYYPADRLDELPPFDIDLAVNVASMQEMTLQTVTRYFELLRERRTSLFYCCNRLEKVLPDGEATRFLEYPWSKYDVHFVDEPCPWHQWWLGVSKAPHARLAGIPIPFAHQYDGMHWHRLTRLGAGT